MFAKQMTIALCAGALMLAGCGDREVSYEDGEAMPMVTTAHNVDVGILSYEQEEDELQTTLEIQNRGESAIVIDTRHDMMQDVILDIAGQKVQARIEDVPERPDPSFLVIEPGRTEQVTLEFPFHEEIEDESTPWVIHMTLNDREQRWTDVVVVDPNPIGEAGSVSLLER